MGIPRLKKKGKKKVFRIWCSHSSAVDDSRLACNTLSLDELLTHIFSSSTAQHWRNVQHSPSQCWKSHTQQESVKSWQTWILSSSTVGTQSFAEHSASTKLYHRRNIHNMWARTTSLSRTYLCCLHHMVRVVVFHWWQFSHVSTALIDAQHKLSSLFACPWNTML